MIKKYKIPFNKPSIVGNEIKYIRNARSNGWLSGDGYYSNKCHIWIEKELNTKKALLTHSCSAAMEMMPLLTDLKPGDEVIMPSFTFVTTANSFVLRGVTPVFVDIKKDTLNIDENAIEQAITKNTKAIMVVHYAGVSAEMESILKIARMKKLFVFEDAAQAFLSKYKNRYLGTIGDLGAFSFHETKNIISGEGGALVINKNKYIERAEIIREKGTNRSKYIRGKLEKYTWVDIGSSYLPSDIIAAFLYAQLEKAREITKKRLKLWSTYHCMFQELETSGHVTRPYIPENVEHNGHIYYLIVKNKFIRDGLINHLRSKSILAPFHYVPLHSSPAGKNYARYIGNMSVTNRISDTLVRLPIYNNISKNEIEKVVYEVKKYLK